MENQSDSSDSDAGLTNSIFSSINEIQRAVTGGVSASVEWLREQAKNVAGRVEAQDIARALQRDRPVDPSDPQKTFLTKRLDRRYVGRMFMYIYDPKTKERLPYYDTLPLVILVEFTSDGFYGLNLHYAPPFIRQKILDALVKNMNRKGISEDAKARMSYRILKRSSRFEIMKPCFKRYLASHVRSSYMYIDPLEWSKAILLPTEHFKKQSKLTVYRNYVAGGLKKKTGRTTRSKTGTP